MGPILMVFLASLVISGVLALPILKLLVALKSRQTVSQHLPEHAAKQGTPTMGGIIIAVGFLAGMVAALLGTAVNSGAKNYLWGFIAVFLAFALIGFVDDYLVPRLLAGKRGLGWTQKLVLQLLATLVFFPVSGITIGLPEAAAGVVVILFFSNAYNFSDGMDALAGSLLVVISTGFAFISYQQGHGELLIPVAAFLGGAIPFLWLNRPPARVFMGDVGSLPIGAVLGLIVCTLSFSGWQPNWVNLAPGEAVPFTSGTWPIWVGLAVASFVMVAELVPVPLQILSVKVRKKRIFPVTPIHHAFQKAGWKETRVVGMFVGVQVACSILGCLIALMGAQFVQDGKRQAAVDHIQELKGGLPH